MNIRARAALSLAPLLQQKSSLDASMEARAIDLNREERSLLKEMCFGVARNFYLLDAIAQQLLTKPLRNKDADVRALVLVGIYQLHFMRTPDHAAINETVNAAKKLKKPWASGLVNGVLRRFVRESEPLLTQANKKPQAQHNHPQWIIDRLKKAWPDYWQSLLEQNDQLAPITLRANALQISADKYAETLRSHSIGFTPGKLSPRALILDETLDVTTLPGFNEGKVSVQDEAAQLAASLLDVQSAHHVLDACCAPGGKTCHILESTPDLDELVAVDLEASRLERVKENLQRLNLKATLHSGAVETLDWWNKKPFDRILLDAPCSATGVIRRHPDIKLLRRDSDIAQLSHLQLTILQSLWPTLKPGGLIVYATCSVLPDENEKLVEAFVKQQADAIHLPIDAEWGEKRPFGRQLFPQLNGHDGFYYARIMKAE